MPPGRELKIKYGDVPLAPLLLLDDIINGAKGLDEARKVNTKAYKLLKKRGLYLNKDKSICIIIVSKKQKEKSSKRDIRKPKICGDLETREKNRTSGWVKPCQLQA